MKKSFEIIDHTADVGLRVWGDSEIELFESAALGMANILYGTGIPAGGKDTKRIHVEASSLDELLLNWLREILFHTERDRVAYTVFQIEGFDFASEGIGKYFIYASLRGTKTTRIGHGICTEIKAVTRHGLTLKKGRVWEARVLFDV